MASLAVNGSISQGTGGQKQEMECPNTGGTDTKDEVLIGQFYLFPKTRTLCKVTVTQSHLISHPVGQDNGSRRGSSRRASLSSLSLSTSIDFKDVIGCHVMKGRHSDDKNAYFCIYHYPFKRKLLGKASYRRRHTTTFVVYQGETIEENMKIAEQWKKAIICQSKGIPVTDLHSCEIPSSKKYLILVNPFSGTRKALTIFNEHVKGTLAEADILYDAVVTEYPNHARDMMITLDLNLYKGIIIISGDGLIYEVINGLMIRQDWAEAIKIPIGTIPGGSGNALSCSINYAAGETFHEHILSGASYILVKHQVIPMDLVVIDTAKERMFSFLSINWGIMADVDIESEKYRRLGPVRFTIGALTRILNLRTYRGRLSFLAAEEYVPKRAKSISVDSLGSLPPPRRSMSMCESGMTDAASGNGTKRRTISSSESYSTFDQTRKISHSESIAEEQLQVVLDEQLQDVTITESEETHGDINRNEAIKPGHTHDKDNIVSYAHTVPTPLLVPLDQEVPDNWTVIEDNFIMVVASYQTHLGKDLLIQPDCQFDDGCMHLSFVRKGASRGVLLGLMSALETGAHLKSPYFETVKCSAFRLEPLTPDGIIAVDGERIDYGTIQAQVLPSVARLMAKPK